MKPLKLIIAIAWIVTLLMSPCTWAEETDRVETGLKLMSQKRYNDAIKAFTTAIEIIPHDFQAYNYRGIVWALKGNFDKAVADYDRAIEIRPRYAEAFNNRGFAKTQQGNLNEALEDYARAIEIDPFLVDAYNNKAWILATSSDRRLRDGVQAVRLAQKSVSLKPDVGSLDTLAAAYAAVGNFDAAIDTQKKAIQKLMLADKTSEVPKYMKHLNTYRARQSLLIDYARAPKVADKKDLKTSVKEKTHKQPPPPPQAHAVVDASKNQKPAVALAEKSKTSLKTQTKTQSSPPAGTHRAVSESKMKKPAANQQVKKSVIPRIKPLPYTIQVSSFRDRQKSNQVARKLITAGDPAFTSPIDIPGKGKWSRVYIGNYKTLAEAKVAAADLKRRKFRYVNITRQPYTIQVGPPVSNGEAQQLKSRLKAKGYLAYSLPARDNPYQIRVVVGAFENEQAAESLSSQLKKDGFRPKVALK